MFADWSTNWPWIHIFPNRERSSEMCKCLYERWVEQGRYRCYLRPELCRICSHCSCRSCVWSDYHNVQPCLHNRWVKPEVIEDFGISKSNPWTNKFFFPIFHFKPNIWALVWDENIVYGNYFLKFSRRNETSVQKLAAKNVFYDVSQLSQSPKRLRSCHIDSGRLMAHSWPL